MLKRLRTAFAASFLAALATQPVMAADPSVKVTAIVEHPALDAVRKGVQDELAANGYKAGQNMSWEFQSAQGDVGTAGQIAKKFVGDNPTVIVAIATPSAQAAVSAAHGRIPVVFSAITDAVGAKLVTNMEKPGANVTGISDFMPLTKHLELIHEAMPKAKTIGVVYNPGETNANTTVRQLKELAPSKGFTVVEGPANDSNGVLPAARSLVGKADVLYVPTDNTVVSALESVVKVAIDGKMPLFAADTASVPRGAAAAVGFDYYEVGRETGRIVLRILKGEKPGDIPVGHVEKTDLVINPASAEKMGLTLPQALVARAAQVVK